MRSIWKYTLDSVGPNTLQLPKGSKALTVEHLDGLLRIWVVVDPAEPIYEDVTFEVYGTGWDIPEPLGEHIGTVFEKIPSGTYMWHVFKAAKDGAGNV